MFVVICHTDLQCVCVLLVTRLRLIRSPLRCNPSCASRLDQHTWSKMKLLFHRHKQLMKPRLNLPSAPQHLAMDPAASHGCGVDDGVSLATHFHHELTHSLQHVESADHIDVHHLLEVIHRVLPEILH